MEGGGKKEQGVESPALQNEQWPCWTAAGEIEACISRAALVLARGVCGVSNPPPE